MRCCAQRYRPLRTALDPAPAHPPLGSSPDAAGPGAPTVRSGPRRRLAHPHSYDIDVGPALKNIHPELPLFHLNSLLIILEHCNSAIVVPPACEFPSYIYFHQHFQLSSELLFIPKIKTSAVGTSVCSPHTVLKTAFPRAIPSAAC